MELPKQDKHGVPYLSYSQLSSFLYNKKDYIKSYFLNEPIKFRDYIDFGSKVGNALEKNDFTKFDKTEQATLKKIKRLDEFEKEIRVDFKDFYLKGFIDTNTFKLDHFMDYKTGSLGKETEYIKPNYIQPHIYALGIYQMCGKMPTKAEVVLIERTGNPMRHEPLKVGKQIMHIPIDISKKRIEEAQALVIKTAEEISRYWQIFKKLNS